ncbi:MAG: hypothetical protein KC729_18150, partial [Candidatus Eisenbacteria bacterium]|nr:hypothetical protein [Candidatus Eisenbacteria bacterium]
AAVRAALAVSGRYDAVRWEFLLATPAASEACDSPRAPGAGEEPFAEPAEADGAEDGARWAVSLPLLEDRPDGPVVRLA